MKNLNLLMLRCRDLEASRGFYETLGMTFIRHAHGNGPEHYAAEDDRGVIELYPAAPDDAADKTALGFAVEDLPRTIQRFSERGAAPGPIRETSWGTTCVIRDPDGRRVELKAATSTKH